MNGKGFYIALALCLVAIGSAAYVASNKSFGLGTTASSTASLTDYGPSEQDTANNAEQTNQNVSGVPEHTSSYSPNSMPTASAPSSSSSSASSSKPIPSSSSKTTSSKLAAATFFVLPVQGNILTPYSNDQPVYDKTLEDWRVHDGIDIAADTGTPVKSCADGIVTDVTVDDMLGQMVTIDNGGGLKSYYANLTNKVTVKKGQKVEAGQEIGAVGNTAQGEISLVPHLHFAMSKNDKFVDPMSVINKK